MLFVSVIYGDGTKLNGYLIDTNMLHVYEYDFSRLHFAPYRVDCKIKTAARRNDREGIPCWFDTLRRILFIVPVKGSERISFWFV